MDLDDLDQTVDIVATSLDTFCQQLEQQGIDPLVINTVLLSVYAARSQEYGDWELFEEQMTAALEDDWPEITLH